MTSRKAIGRRDALKVLAASTGAVLGAAALPGEWTKPVVETGVLPVHAQASASITIQAVAIDYWVDGPASVGLTFSYVDSIGGFDPAWTIHYQFEGFAWRSALLNLPTFIQSGDGFSGTFTTSRNMAADDFFPATESTVSFYITGEGRTSNTVNIFIEANIPN
jgi:hypothetical protein